MAELVTHELDVQKKTGIDYGKSLTWYFSDPKFWTIALKFSLLLISCIFILPMFYVVPLITGYINQVARNVQAGNFILPELGEDGQWQEGVIFTLAYMGVTFALVFVFMLVYFPLVFGMAAVDDSEIAVLLLTLVSFAVQFLFYFVFTGFIYAMWIVFIKTQSVRAMFSIRNSITVLRKNWVSLIVSFLIFYAATYAFTFVGMLALCVGIFPAMFASYLVLASLLGQMDMDGIE